MATYGPTNDETRAMVHGLIADFHPDHAEAETRIGAVFAYPTLDKYGMAKAPAVTEYGMGVLAKPKINGEADRVQGEPDATIIIDHPAWEEMAPEGRESLIDRMLHALVVRRRKGVILTDDRGRPRLKNRKPDWCITGFRAMAERHKGDSIEVIQARQFRDEFGQLLFGFAEDVATQATLPGAEEPRPRPRRRKAGSVAAANR